MAFISWRRTLEEGEAGDSRRYGTDNEAFQSTKETDSATKEFKEDRGRRSQERSGDMKLTLLLIPGWEVCSKVVRALPNTRHQNREILLV